MLHVMVALGSFPCFYGAGFNYDDDSVQYSFLSFVNAWGEAAFYVAGITQFYMYSIFYIQILELKRLDREVSGRSE